MCSGHFQKLQRGGLRWEEFLLEEIAGDVMNRLENSALPKSFNLSKVFLKGMIHENDFQTLMVRQRTVF